MTTAWTGTRDGEKSLVSQPMLEKEQDTMVGNPEAVKKSNEENEKKRHAKSDALSPIPRLNGRVVGG